MERREFLGRVATTVSCASIWSVTNGCSGSGGKDAVKAKLPNIVYILADDMGYGDVSCLNPESKIPTPRIDSLARDGMSFTDAHSGSSVCTPTRYGVLTGRYSWRTRLKENVLGRGFEPHLINEGRMTVQSMLKEHGYKTACIGKWHLGMDLPTTDGKPADKNWNVDWHRKIRNNPCDTGFDYFYGMINSLGNPPYIWIENDRFIGECSIVKGFDVEGPCTADFDPYKALPDITERTVKYIEKQDGEKPFFVYMALTAPHFPLVPSPEFQGKNELGAYGDLCMQVDWTVGQVLDALKRKGFDENTIVVFTSDNGCAPYADVEGMEAKGHFPSYIYRGYKSMIWDGGHRIPFLVRWPKMVKSLTVCDKIICLTDLLATCSELVEYKLPANAGEDSFSILSALYGDDSQLLRRPAVVHHSFNGMFSIRQGKWKLEFCPGSGGWVSPTEKQIAEQGLARVQLYDMEGDVREKHNVSDKYPGVVERLTKLMTEYVVNGRSTKGPAQSNDGAKWWPQLNWMNKEGS
ncbi:MAG: arylsulfatase [Planctomycetes bacterium]|nr:arylsulfatase [Planctomycetota bacterium]